ncbi:glycerol kinase GlpK [Candidatus Margulisiibacteriota bacterium]
MYILAIDQGTTGTTAIIFDAKGQIVAKAYQEFRQIYPKPGWVEHDAEEIWQTVISTVNKAINKCPGDILAIGITNQRETTVIWDKTTGKPIYNAIVWQCRRTAEICAKLEAHKEIIHQKTGLPLDAYFSGTKIKWLLENINYQNTQNLLFGTIDTWLIWKLTNGQVHATDYTNASRTLLFNIKEIKWDPELLSAFKIPASLLPEVKKSIDFYGNIETINAIKGKPILGVAGDQQAALFGQACFQEGQVKNTYGTGCFVVMNTGQKLIHSQQGLASTLAVDQIGNPCYALEGSIFIAGAAIQWLRDELKILNNAKESEKMAQSVKDNGGVYLVPAFVGLGAPHWDMNVRGALLGLTRCTNRNHIVRAALEAMAYQTQDVLSVMAQESQHNIDSLMVDGGAVENDFLLQFQADMIGKQVLRPKIIESTALGVGLMAGLKSGLWQNSQELAKVKTIDKIFSPKMDSKVRENLISGWQQAIRQVKTR